MKYFKLNTKGLGECPTVLLKLYCTAGDEIGVEVASARQVVDVLFALKNNQIKWLLSKRYINRLDKEQNQSF